MSKVSPRRTQISDWLFGFLSDLPSGATLPWLSEIARHGPHIDRLRTTHEDIRRSLGQLQQRRLITWRSGTNFHHRGHQALRLIATGRVIKTYDCPFDPPQPEPLVILA